MFGIFDKQMRSVDTRGVNGTLVIGVSFILIAYILHPLVESAYYRVRAYRAWLALENREAVEVTNHSMLAVTLGGRGKWDTARIVTVLLAVFSLFSWGLELSMDLAFREGWTDLLNILPPVTVEIIDGVEVWKVKAEDEFNYDGNWRKDFNMDDDEAFSLYDVKKAETCRNGRTKGTIRVAFWSGDAGDAPAELHYYKKDTTTTVKDLKCAEPQVEKRVRVGDDANHWGSVLTCDNGPELSTSNNTDGDPNSPPTLIINHFGGNTSLIVEESSNYPSFLYSVWTNGTQSNGSVELTHVFHIGATVRLAEALVTAIVQGKTTGRECFLLVRVNSDNDSENEDKEQEGHESQRRAKPFGEDPTNERVEIQNLERLECGLALDLTSLICLVLLTLLTTVGIVWSFCLRSSIGMNVYDRDELIRAVSMSPAAKHGNSPSAIRIFVRKEDSGSLSVVISDTGEAETGCGRILGRKGPVVEDTEPPPNAAHVALFNNGYGGAAVPSGRPTMWLEGVRTGMSRQFPGRNGDFCYPASTTLSASPVPSPACSPVGTPVRYRPPPPRVPREVPTFPEGRGASILFDRSFSPSDSGEDEHDGMQEGKTDTVESEGAPSARVMAPGNPRDVSGMPRDVHPPYLGEWSRSIRRVAGSSRTSQANEGLSPVPQFMRNFSTGPPQLGPLSRGGGEEFME